MCCYTILLCQLIVVINFFLSSGNQKKLSEFFSAKVNIEEALSFLKEKGIHTRNFFILKYTWNLFKQTFTVHICIHKAYEETSMSRFRNENFNSLISNRFELKVV